jgi:hypothetical protein
MNGNGTTGIGSGASLAGRIRRAEFEGEWMYEEDAVEAGCVLEDGDLKGKGRARDGDDDDDDVESESSRKTSGEHVMPVKREEFVRLVLQALREVGYRYVDAAVRSTLADRFAAKQPKSSARNPDSKRKTKRRQHYATPSSAVDGANPSRSSNPSVSFNPGIVSPCAGKTHSRPTANDKAGIIQT